MLATDRFTCRHCGRRSADLSIKRCRCRRLGAACRWERDQAAAGLPAGPRPEKPQSRRGRLPVLGLFRPHGFDRTEARGAAAGRMAAERTIATAPAIRIATNSTRIANRTEWPNSEARFKLIIQASSKP